MKQLSKEELGLYIEKAHKLKKTGLIWLIISFVCTIVGFVLFYGSWAGNFGSSSTASIGLFMFLGGICMTGIGFLRIKQGYRIKNTTFND